MKLIKVSIKNEFQFWVKVQRLKTYLTHFSIRFWVEIGLNAFALCTPTFNLCTPSQFMFWIYLGLHNAPPCLLHIPHIILFLTPLSHFTHPTYLLRASPICDGLAPYVFVYLFLGLLLCLLCAPPLITHVPRYFCFPLLSFLNNLILL